MSDQFARTRMLYGDDAVEKFRKSRIAVFGIGGVGGHVVEALVRSGIGTVDIIDNDTVSPLTQTQSKQLLNLLDNNNWVSGRTKTAYSHIIITPDNIYYFSTRYSEVINNLTNNTFCLIDENTKKQINKILD